MDRQNLNYEELILVRLGEITLKGLNRGRFENKLLQNMAYRLKREGSYIVFRKDSRIWIRSGKDNQKMDTEAITKAIRDVFGIVSLSPVRCLGSNLEDLDRNVLDMAKQAFAPNKKTSFKVDVKRVDKNFPLRSYDVACRLGDLILEAYPENACVDVLNPEITFYVELRDNIYLYRHIIPARKGLPVGMSGKGMLMLSGGIDSPVAGYLMASRGMRVSCVYFHTFPYTSNEAKQKVIDLARILTRYSGDVDLHIVNFTEVQLALNEACPEDMMTIVMRRMMVRISQEIAKINNIPCLITGESLGQVASQTVDGLVATDYVAEIPIFRPLIGLDKEEIITISRDIETYETSILPYEDCCTVFVAKHPKTHPSLRDATRAEDRIDIESLVNGAVENTETIRLYLSEELEN